jgi:hypothetical protein
MAEVCSADSHSWHLTCVTKRGWPRPRDVQSDGEWPMPVRQVQVEEVVRNFFIRQPLLWLS